MSQTTKHEIITYRKMNYPTLCPRCGTIDTEMVICCEDCGKILGTGPAHHSDNLCDYLCTSIGPDDTYCGMCYGKKELRELKQRQQDGESLELYQLGALDVLEKVFE